jgi:ABC-type proline/glycine betaine transport system permease subunit
MKIVPTYGPTRNPRMRIVALTCAALMIVMLVSQLFTYEDFPSTLDVLLPINDQPLVHLTAALVVIAELFALPYLFGMYLSKLIRVFSGLFAVAVAGFWLIMSLTNAHAANSALFSTTFKLPGGIVAAVWSLVLFGMLVWVIFYDSKFRHASSS